MQLISAIVRPAKVDKICDALQTFGFRGLTVLETHGFGKQRGRTEIYRSAKFSSEFRVGTKIEIVALDEDVAGMIDVICKVGATGRQGDGKIWVTPVQEFVRIRTREVGADAL